MDSSKLFIDSDCLLDVLLKREPFVKYSQDLLLLSQKKSVKLYTSSLAVANINYVLSKTLKSKIRAKEYIRILTTIVDILPVEKEDILTSLNGDFRDFEDGIQSSVAEKNKCEYLITRNLKDYKSSSVNILTADQFLKIFKS